jgi:multidrug efflux pump subunit AcrA (membrane-fusion protein)
MDRKSMEEELRAAQAQYGATAAAARQAEVDVEDARRRLQLETKAVAEGISPRATLDEARLAVKRAQAAASKARSAVAQESSHVQTARDHLADLALRAPAEGTVAMRFKDPGSTVPAGTPIVRIVGRGAALRLKFAVPPDRAQKLEPGSAVKVTVDTVAAPVTATIRQVSPALDPSSGMIIVEAELGSDGASANLRPGLAAWVN